MIDWTVSVGNLLQIGAFVILGITMFLTMRGDINILRHDVQSLEKGQLILNEAFAQLGTILTQVAVQDNRLLMIEKSMDDLKHGQGFVKLPKTLT